MSPYETNLVELIGRFAYSPQRIKILRGLLSYRSDLHAIGISNGWQLLDGSFMEDVESLRDRPPADIDLVTFSPIPGEVQAKQQLMQDNLDLFDAARARLRYGCDGYFVDLDDPVELVADSTRYWFGLFTHQRETLLWKGILKVPMADDNDGAALTLLNEREHQQGGVRHAQKI
ncbi:MAG TPA: hypothetical protein VF800_21770 [Telluria sp.]